MGLRRRKNASAAAVIDVPAENVPEVVDTVEVVDKPGTELAVKTPQSFTAAVASVQIDGVSWKTWRFGDRAWQRDGWRLYDITGQLRFVANWVGNSVSRCRLYVAEVDQSGEAAGEVEDARIADLAAVPLGRGPAKDEALRLAGINLYVPGECYMVAEAEGNEDGTDRWFVVSGRQIRRAGDQVTVKRSQLHGGGVMVYREGVDMIIRCWTPHPADTDQPDSPTRSAIPDLREIEAIRKREFAELDSRLSGAGLLPLPEGCDFPRGDNDPPGHQGFARVLMRAMATSLQDRSSAEALVPIMFTVPGEFLDKIKPVTFWSELSAELRPMREAAIRSLAQSLDIPPEVMLGLGDTNHWSAWAISEEAVTTQIQPVLSRIADALTQGYLRPALERLGLDPDAYVYAFDTAPLTTRPNRTADALNYHERGLLSDEAALAAGAWGPENMPAQDERLRRLVEKAVVANPTLLLDPVIRDIVGLAQAPVLPAGEEPSGDDDGDGEPETDPRSIPEQTPQSEEQAALVAVSNLAVRRALSLAGGRLVPHRQRDRWPDTPRHQLHTRHGLITRERADEVLRGAWEDVPAVVEELAVDPVQLATLLHGFCVELLTRGLAYDTILLRDLLRAASTRVRCRT